MSGRTTEPSAEYRQKVRDQWDAETPPGYSPWFHLLFPSLCGLAIITGCLWFVRGVKAWELALLPVYFVILNAAEWRLHKDVLHKRQKLMALLYDRHTPLHHVVFITEDMALRSKREFRMVLIPAYGIFGALFGSLPVPIVLGLLGQLNAGLLYIVMAMAYTVTYEWLHLSYHLPPDSFIGRLRLIRWLRRHHATHHNPQLMQKWNFNVSIPLWDWVRGTVWREEPDGAALNPASSQPGNPRI